METNKLAMFILYMYNQCVFTFNNTDETSRTPIFFQWVFCLSLRIPSLRIFQQEEGEDDNNNNNNV